MDKGWCYWVITWVMFVPLLFFPAAGSAQTPRPTQARPLLVGNWADPTILKDGNDYYMTHSSFQLQPGLLIWHSKDLRTWRPIAHAVVNQEGSIWAPELIKHGGRYYIYYPATGTNWVVTAEKITGPWSKPVSIGVGHIDPGHVVGQDGRRYIHLSGGHAVEMSVDGMKALTRPEKVYHGWPIPRDWTIECFCLESPKLTYREGWYYLTSAQGGLAARLRATWSFPLDLGIRWVLGRTPLTIPSFALGAGTNLGGRRAMAHWSKGPMGRGTACCMDT